MKMRNAVLYLKGATIITVVAACKEISARTSVKVERSGLLPLVLHRTQERIRVRFQLISLRVSNDTKLSSFSSLR